MLSLDVEQDGLHFKDPLVSVAFTYKARDNTCKSKSFGINHPEEVETEATQLGKVQDIISKCNLIVGHNIKFDVKTLIHNGINFKHRPTIIDTQIMYWLYTGHREKQKSLEYVCTALGIQVGKVSGFDFKKNLASTYPLKELLHYNEVDTQLPILILEKILDKIPVELVKFYSDLTYFFADTEMNGMCIDEGKLNEMYQRTSNDLDTLRNTMYKYLEQPINIGSGQQLSCALYGGEYTETVKVKHRLKFKTWPIWRWKWKNVEVTHKLKGLGFGTSKLNKLKNGYWPTDKATLLQLRGKTKKAKEYIELYRRYNKLNTMFEKFIVKYLQHADQGLVHPNFNLSNTLTGRTSCSDPNVQQNPRPDPELPNLKSLFVSRFGENGRILEVDFSGAEWRHAAWRSQDPQMIKDIVDGLDAHTITAMNFHGCKYDEVTSTQRQDAKPINFRFLYGGTAMGFYLSDLVSSVKEGQAYITGIYKNYPQLKYSHDRDKAVAKGSGRLEMCTGRWYDYRGEMYKDSKVLNYPNQGSSSDMTLACNLMCMKIVKDKLGEDVKIVNTVHDCLICDCVNDEVALKAERIIKYIFTNAHKYVRMYFKDMDLSSVPIDAESEIGISWGNMNEIKGDLKDVKD